MRDELLPWSIAWKRAATGIGGFYRSEAAEDHFATAVTDNQETAERIVDLSATTLTALAERYASVRVIDAGAGDGTLLQQLIDCWPPQLRSVTTWLGIDVRARPSGVSESVEWLVADVSEPCNVSIVPGLLIAHELLDDIPCDIVEVDDDGATRLVLVNASTGRQELGPRLDDQASCAMLGVDATELDQWCTTWWQRHEPAARIEVGLRRDAVWRRLSAFARPGMAIAVDYAHTAADRSAGRWDAGTLVGYHRGMPASPIPDGTCNLSAHVALDACAAAVPHVMRQELTFGPPTTDFAWLVQCSSSTR